MNVTARKLESLLRLYGRRGSHAPLPGPAPDLTDRVMRSLRADQAALAGRSGWDRIPLIPLSIGSLTAMLIAISAALSAAGACEESMAQLLLVSLM